MTNRNLVYWIAQFAGWILYVLVIGGAAYLQGDLTRESVQTLVLSFILGILSSHIYRGILIKIGWLEISLIKLIPRVLITAIIYGITFYLILGGLVYMIWAIDVFQLNYAISLTLNFTLVCILWSLIYFAFHFFDNYRKEEIKNLQFEASRNEIELNNLRAQLNPHFMFNAMNSIRALINEDPEQAKKSVTQLSNILRSTLLMGRKRFVQFEEELNVIKDYLLLESVRYEERLKVSYNVDPETLKCYIPPLMLQTIVENAIKHGISNLTQGGVVRIESQISGKSLILTVENSGTLSKGASHGTGTGLRNARERLKLLYGTASEFKIYNQSDDLVVTKIKLPKQTEYEGNNR